MDKILKVVSPKTDVGVIIARFQTPNLTEAHHELLCTVLSKHQKVCVLLGISPVMLTEKNPLDFNTRRLMIAKDYPTVLILPLHDKRTDVEWSKNIDALLRSVYPIETIALYGGRDSFIPHYRGKFKTVELEAQSDESATKLRQAAFHTVVNSDDFRRGICYSTANQYNQVHMTVDIAVENNAGDEVLLARKPGEDGYRFVGGYVNPKESLEAAARREASEETGGSIAEVNFIGSFPINDWRYADIQSKSITTAFFQGRKMYGQDKAMDDIEEVKWFKIADIYKVMFMPEHEELRHAYATYRGIKKPQQAVSNVIKVEDVCF
jgi:bifunctional NMN adenylyltransferase/nudix hydrolase